MKVLYVDDEAEMLAMQTTFDIMSREGIEVISLSRIDEVLPWLEGNRSGLDGIVLDVLMPPLEMYSLDETDQGVSTGVRLLRDIREKWPTIPVVIVSVRDKGRLSHLVRKYDVAACLSKPVLGTDLADTLRGVLAGGQG